MIKTLLSGYLIYSVEMMKYGKYLKLIHDELNQISDLMKKIKKEIGYIYFTDYMYIIQYDKYIALVLYEVDPKKHLLKPTQVELIIKREGKRDQE
jgi:hypothetical protein